VRLFHEPGRFRRADAIPRPLARTLFGKGTVHTHDGEAHRHRKAMFLSLLDPTAAREIAAVADRLWQAAVDRWRDGRRVVVLDEAVRVIGVAICGWPACRSHPTTRAVGSGTWSRSGSGRQTPVIGWPQRGLSTRPRRPASGWLPGGRRPVVSPYTSVWADPALVSPRTHDDDAGPPDLAVLTANGQGVD